MWLVERTYPDDEQNIVILVYATTEGDRYLRKERALTSFSDDRATTAAVDVAPSELGTVDDAARRTEHAAAVERTRDQYEPSEAI
ncbi:hypothetical protein ACNS7O_10845 [Haloferacaceae archaeon DSL9]